MSDEAKTEKETPAKFWKEAGLFDYTLFEQKDLSEDQLEANKGWQDACKIVYELKHGEGSWEQEVKKNKWKPEEAAKELGEWGSREMSRFDNNLAYMGASLGIGLSKATDAQKQAVAFMMEAYDHKSASWSGFGRGLVAMTWDPTTYIGIGTLGLGTVAAQGGKYATKEAVLLAVRQGVREAMKDGIRVGTQEAVEAGVKKAVTEAVKNGSRKAVFGIEKDLIEHAAKLGAGNTLKAAERGGFINAAQKSALETAVLDSTKSVLTRKTLAFPWLKETAHVAAIGAVDGAVIGGAHNYGNQKVLVGGGRQEAVSYGEVAKASAVGAAAGAVLGPAITTAVPYVGKGLSHITDRALFSSGHAHANPDILPEFSPKLNKFKLLVHLNPSISKPIELFAVGNLRPRSFMITRPVIENMDQKLLRSGIADDLIKLDKAVLEAARDPRVNATKLIDDFATNPEMVAKLDTMAREAAELRTHVENTYLTNGERKHNRVADEANGGTKAGADKVGWTDDLTSAQKKALVQYLESIEHLAADIKKGSSGLNGQQMLETLAKIANKERGFSYDSVANSVTGLSQSASLAHEATIRITKKLPNGDPAAKPFYQSRERIIDLGTEPPPFTLKPISYSDTVGGNLEATWFEMLHFADRGPDGKLVTNFREDVNTKNLYAGKVAQFIIEGYGHEAVFILKQHQKLLQPEGSQLQQPFPSAADFLEAMDKIALKRGYEKDPTFQYYKNQIADLIERGESVQEGAKDQKWLADFRNKWFGINRQMASLGEVRSIYLDSSQRWLVPGYSSAKPESIPRNVFLRYQSGRFVDYLRGASEQSPGTSNLFGVNSNDYHHRNVTWRKTDKSGNEIEGGKDVFARSLGRIGSVGLIDDLPALWRGGHGIHPISFVWDGTSKMGKVALVGAGLSAGGAFADNGFVEGTGDLLYDTGMFIPKIGWAAGGSLLNAGYEHYFPSPSDEKPAGGTTTTPPADGATTTPPAGGATTTPAGGATTTPPAGGTTTTPPAGGTTTTPPAGGTTTTPPAGGTTTTPPAGGTTTTPPAGGTTTTPPAGGAHGSGQPAAAPLTPEERELKEAKESINLAASSAKKNVDNIQVTYLNNMDKYLDAIRKAQREMVDSGKDASTLDPLHEHVLQMRNEMAAQLQTMKEAQQKAEEIKALADKKGVADLAEVKELAKTAKPYHIQTRDIGKDIMKKYHESLQEVEKYPDARKYINPNSSDFFGKAFGKNGLGGENGLLGRITQDNENGGPSVLSGAFNSVANWGKGVHSWWTQDVKRSVAGDKSAENWYMAANVGLGIVGAFAAINLINNVVPGVEISGGMKWLIVAAAAAYFLHKTGETGNDFNELTGKASDYSGNAYGGAQVTASVQGSASNLPVSAPLSQPLATAANSTTTQDAAIVTKTGEPIKTVIVDASGNYHGITHSGEMKVWDQINNASNTKRTIDAVVSGACANLPNGTGEVFEQARRVDNGSGTSDEVMIRFSCEAPKTPTAVVRV